MDIKFPNIDFWDLPLTKQMTNKPIENGKNYIFDSFRFKFPSYSFFNKCDIKMKNLVAAFGFLASTLFICLQYSTSWDNQGLINWSKFRLNKRILEGSCTFDNLVMTAKFMCRQYWNCVVNIHDGQIYVSTILKLCRKHTRLPNLCVDNIEIAW